METFATLLQKFRRHLYNIRQQYAFSRALKQNLPANQCPCWFLRKLYLQIQCRSAVCSFWCIPPAGHFTHWCLSHGGRIGSYLLLHHIGIKIEGTTCNMETHGAHSEGNPRKIPRCDNCAFFFSDGPCTQYKQRRNFYLFCTEIFKKGFTRGTWNYFEASHGKGAPDGIGGTLKRRADRLVSQGVDIPTAMSLYQALNDGQSKVKLFYIQEQDVDDAVKEMPADLPAVPSTMRLHQVFTSLFRHDSYLVKALWTNLCMTDLALPGDYSFTWKNALPRHQLHVFCKWESGM